MSSPLNHSYSSSAAAEESVAEAEAEAAAAHTSTAPRSPDDPFSLTDLLDTASLRMEISELQGRLSNEFLAKVAIQFPIANGVSDPFPPPPSPLLLLTRVSFDCSWRNFTERRSTSFERCAEHSIRRSRRQDSGWRPKLRPPRRPASGGEPGRRLISGQCLTHSTPTPQCGRGCPREVKERHRKPPNVDRVHHRGCASAAGRRGDSW